MSVLTQFGVEPDEIRQIIFERLMPSLEGQQTGAGLLAMVTYSLFLMKPDIKMEELQHCIEETCQFMAMVLVSTEPFDSGAAVAAH